MISQFFSFAYSARPFPPYKPCSSPDNPVYIIELSNLYLDKTLAASIVPAMPEALSFAPGESDSKSFGSETLLSISPLIITYRFGYLVPFWIATTLLIQTSRINLLPSALK